VMSEYGGKKRERDEPKDDPAAERERLQRRLAPHLFNLQLQVQEEGYNAEEVRLTVSGITPTRPFERRVLTLSATDNSVSVSSPRGPQNAPNFPFEVGSAGESGQLEMKRRRSAPPAVNLGPSLSNAPQDPSRSTAVEAPVGPEKRPRPMSISSLLGSTMPREIQVPADMLPIAIPGFNPTPGLDVVEGQRLKSLEISELRPPREILQFSPRPWECESCGQTFFSQASLNDHRTREHGIPLEPLSRFLSSTDSELPLPRLSGLNPVGFGLGTTGTLLQPPPSSSTTCRLCGLAFGHPKDLRRHLSREHRDEKPFVCELCSGEKAFARNADMKKHIKLVHEHQRPYSCDQCKASFGLKIGLTRHVETVHEKKRPYSCPMCDSHFGTNSNLSKHIARKHSEKKQSEHDSPS